MQAGGYERHRLDSSSPIIPLPMLYFKALRRMSNGILGITLV